MTTDPSTTLAEAEAVLRRLGERRRELTDRRAALQRQIEGAARVDQAGLAARVRATLAGEHGLAARRAVGRLVDDVAEVDDELGVVGLSIEQQKAEVSAARRRHARSIAAELAPEHDTVIARIIAALEELLAAQADERKLHDQVRQASGVEGVLPELGRPIPGVDHLLARAREHLAANARAAA